MPVDRRIVKDQHYLVDNAYGCKVIWAMAWASRRKRVLVCG